MLPPYTGSASPAASPDGEPSQNVAVKVLGAAGLPESAGDLQVMLRLGSSVCTMPLSLPIPTTEPSVFPPDLSPSGCMRRRGEGDLESCSGAKKKDFDPQKKP